MKKIIMILICGVSYTSLITNTATAQRATNASYNKAGSAENDKAAATGPAEKTAIKDVDDNLKAAKANLKVNTHLNKNFKNVSGLTWSSEDKVIVATFKMDEKSARVVYNKKGNWLYTIINYQEDQMPADVRSLVKSSYGDFSISLVQEINQGGITLYKVHLEDCTRIKQILVYNGEITLYGDYTKSK